MKQVFLVPSCNCILILSTLLFFLYRIAYTVDLSDDDDYVRIPDFWAENDSNTNWNTTVIPPEIQIIYMELEGCYYDETHSRHTVQDTIVIRAKDPLNDSKIIYNLYNVESPSTEINSSLFTSRDPFNFIVYPYELMPSWYMVLAKIFFNGKYNTIMPESRCVIIIEEIALVVKITGSPLIIADAGKELTLYSNETFDPYKIWFPHRDLDDLPWYLWNCTQKTQPATFCERNVLSERSTLTIPVEFMKADEEFEIFLFAAGSHWNNKSQIGSTQVTVQIVKNRIKLQIACVKNCPPVTPYSDLSSYTYLNVTCIKNCQEIKPKDFQWTIEPRQSDATFKFDYEKKTKFGRWGYKFLIVRNGVTKSGSYSIKVDIKNKIVCNNSVIITFAPVPNVKNCKVIPSKGYTLETKFKFKCQQPLQEIYSYELYADERFIIKGNSSQVFRKTFLLPASEHGKFHLKVTSFYTSTLSVPLSPTVESRRSKLSLHQAQDRLDSALKNVEKGLGNNNPKATNELLAVADELANQFNDSSAKNWADEMKLKLVGMIENMSLPDIQSVIQAGDVLEKLVLDSNSPQNDLQLAGMVASICTKMANKFLQLVRSKSAPILRDRESERMSSVLSKCHRATLLPNSDIFKPFVMTTKSPTSGDVISEDYADYEDLDEHFNETLQKMQNVTSNILTSSLITAKFLAMNAAIGEGQLNATDKNASIVINKDTGDNLFNHLIICGSVQIYPPEDFKGDNHCYDILVSAWKRDLTWWNPAHTYVATEIVNIQFWHSTCKKRIWEFKYPVRLVFNVSATSMFEYKIAHITLEIPNNFQHLKGADLNPYIKVRRLRMRAGYKCRITFEGLSDDDVLEIAFVLMEYPSYKDFKSTKSICARNNFIHFTNTKKYDAYGYVAILPANATARKKSLTFNMTAVNILCVRWNTSSNIWEVNGEANLTADTKHARSFECVWKTFSVLAGYLQNVENLSQDLQTLNFEMTLQAYMVIFITTAAIVVIYCLLIICVLFFRQQSNYYYLADNSPADRFAYLIRVRTGIVRNSGTTSHIMVRLHGSHSTCDPHVLNYPDPKNRLLQSGNEDSFILTTDAYLGPIERLEIWFDCSGPSPSWYCKDIVIYDMQLKRQLYFSVDRRFSLVKGLVKLHVEPTGETPKLSWLKRLRPFDRLHTWLCMNEYDSFGLIKRLTVIISSTVTIAAIILVWMDVVDGELNDAFDLYDYHIGSREILISLVTSVLVFSVHVIITWMFRFSRVQYPPRSYTKVPIPFMSTFICWILLIAFIVISITYLMVCGFWVPTILSYIWLTMCAISLAFNIIFLENLTLIIRKFVCPKRKLGNFEERQDNILRAIGTQRIFLHRHMKDIGLLRPHMKQMYAPMKENELKEMVVKMRLRIVDELEDLIMFSIYIFILYMVFLHNKGFYSLEATLGMKDLLNGLHTRTAAFDKISAPKGVYEYLNETFIKVLHSSEWYEGYVSHDPGLMHDYANKFLGIVRLRQQRMKSDRCTVPKIMHFLQTKGCRPEFDKADEDESSHGYFWGPPTEQLEGDRLKYIWSHVEEEDTDTFLATGKFATYSGGGYIAYLGRKFYNSYANFKTLVAKQWIDGNSRSLFVEFLTYNVNNNGFNAVRLTFEMSAAGYANTFIAVSTVKMLYVLNELELAAMISFVLFVIWVVLLTIKQTVGFIVKVRTFYKDIWFMIDLFIVLMSITCIILMTIRMKMVGDYLTKVEHSKHNEFISYFPLFDVENGLTICAAFLVTTATVRLWRLLRWAELFRIMERSLILAALPLVAASLTFAIILFAFGLSGVILFGDDYPELHSLVDIMRTLLTLVLKPDQFRLMNFMDEDLSYIYFTLYLFIMLIMMFTFIVILIMSFIKAKVEASGRTVYYSVQEYFKEQFKYLPKLVRAKLVRLRGGGRILKQEEMEDFLHGKSERIIAKEDELRFAGSLSVSKSSLEAMKFITKCVVRNLGQGVHEKEVYTESDNKLMVGVCKAIIAKKLHEDEFELFYKGHFEGEKYFRLLDEKKVSDMAKLVDVMLGGKEEPPKKDKKKATSKNDYNKCLKIQQECKQTLKRCDALLSIIQHKVWDVEIRLKQEIRNAEKGRKS